MAVALKVNQLDMQIAMTVSVLPEAVALKVVEIGGEFPDKYTGSYEVTPILNNNITLATNRKLMTDDVTVKKIPVVQTTNLFGGKTVVIG